MSADHSYFSEHRRHQPRKQLLKSYLIEANAGDFLNEKNGLLRFFEKIHASASLSVNEGRDTTLRQARIGNHDAEFFIDTYDPRFWIVHSLAPAQEADQAIKQLVQRTRLLDSFWIPCEEFESWAQEAGTPRTVSGKFAINTGLYQENIQDEAFQDESFYLKIGSSANAMLRWKEFQSAEQFRNLHAIWSARIHRRHGTEDEAPIAIDEVTAAGKVTARGNSFSPHEAILRVFQKNYRDLITGWEEKYRSKYRTLDGGLAIEGQVATIEWHTPPLSEALFQQIIRQMFNSGEPYRLYGAPVQSFAERVSVQAVDLHTGGPIRLELSPKRLWIHLNEKSCGNVIARLLTNLQHYLDARADLV